MKRPEIRIIAISNVFSRMMRFHHAGDVEQGHQHHHDHGTLVANGALRVEMLDDNENVISTRDFSAPSFVFIAKEHMHRLTALQDNTVAACIHAMRDIDNNILAPDFLLDQKRFADQWSESDNINDHYHLYMQIKRGVHSQGFSNPKEKKPEVEG